jgi:molybdopterin-binding protein
MAISARNKLQGRVSSIKSGEAMCLVTLDAQGTKIVAAVTNQGVEELKLKQNDQVTAVIKSTEVMLMKGGGQVTLRKQGDQVTAVVKATEVMLMK